MVSSFDNFYRSGVLSSATSKDLPGPRVNYYKHSFMDGLLRASREQFKLHLSVGDRMTGIVLQSLGPGPLPPDHLLSERYENAGEYFRYKIRVPEVHVNYPLPNSEKSDEIDLYPICVATDEQFSNLEVGSTVYVTFLNKRRLSSPIISGIGETAYDSREIFGGNSTGETNAKRAFGAGRFVKYLSDPDRVPIIGNGRGSSLIVVPDGILGYPMTHACYTNKNCTLGIKYGGDNVSKGRKGHAGVDFFDNDGDDGKWSVGTPILAIADGKISFFWDADKYDADSKYTKVIRECTTVVRSGKKYQTCPGVGIYGETLYPFTRSLTSDKKRRSGKRMGIALTLIHPGNKYVSKSIYMHLAAIAPGLSHGSSVLRGQVIGYLGGTDVMTDAPHLHLETHKDGKVIDPGRLVGTIRENKIGYLG